MARYDYSGWRPYVSAAQRRRKAQLRVAKLQKAGRVLSPIEIQGRKIARTFWGEAWCRNLESYSDYSNRLPRGRTYLRNGSVLDLQIEAGRVTALVNGSTFYDVTVRIAKLEAKRWKALNKSCSGQIQSLVELLQGRLSQGVMEIVTQPGKGLFPKPTEIGLECSCPDWAVMCKHVAAALYGIGARLDHHPELLFVLRGVDPAEMVESAVEHQAAPTNSRHAEVLPEGELADIFGIEFAPVQKASPETPAKKKAAKKKATKKKAVGTKTPRRKATKKKAVGTKTPRRKATKKKAVGTKTPRRKATKKKAVGTKTPRRKATKKKAVGTKTPRRKATKKKAVGTKTPRRKATKKKATFRVPVR